MKYWLIAPFILTMAAAAHAQAPHMTPQMQEMIQKMQNMTPQERAAWAQKMQQQGQQMHKCVNENGGMQKFADRGKAINEHVQELCKQGRRDEAQTYAMEKGRELANDPDLKKMKECSKDMSKTMPYINQAVDDEIDANKHKNVCDINAGE